MPRSDLPLGLHGAARPDGGRADGGRADGRRAASGRAIGTTPRSAAAPRSPQAAAWLPTRRVPPRALAETTRALAVMVGARLPLVDALRTAARQADHDRLGAVLGDVARRVERGSDLAGALGRHPRVFGRLYAELARAGERAGVLDAVLLRLAGYLDAAEALRRRVRLAMAYPAVVLAVALGAVAFLLAVIVPTFADMFADFGAELPWPTRALIALSDGLQAYGLFIVVATAVLVLLARRAARTERGGRALDGLRLRLPLLGPLARKAATARFCRTLGTLTASGVPLTDALGVTAEASENAVVRGAARAVRRRVERGDALAGELGRAGYGKGAFGGARGGEGGLFPPMVVQMIAVGEETARLPEMLLHVAEHYEDEVDASVDALTSVIEPVLIVVLGVVVGAILVAIYLPMFELTNVVQ